MGLMRFMELVLFSFLINILNKNMMENIQQRNHLFRVFAFCLFIIATIEMYASEKIGRPVKIVSLCFHEESMNKIINIIDKEGESDEDIDIIVLPETWRGQITPESLGGETINSLSILAKKHNVYILSPIDIMEGKLSYNTAVLIDRKGDVVFTYDKIYPYWSEFDLNPPVEPGKQNQMGVAICYDANFPDVWQELRNQGAEIVFWPSAYSAGSQLQAYSLLHHYYIVTSTYTGDCQVYDITGEKIIDNKSDKITITNFTLDLDRGIYHENFNLQKLNRFLEVHREDVEVEINMPREQWFVLKAKKPGISARSLANKFDIEELVDYQNRSSVEINNKR